jgi:glycosyltransferase involved in cell wall biosynthesis
MNSVQKSNILFVGTFPPKKCGIASFTQDLAEAVGKEISNDMGIAICALDKPRNKGMYEESVTMLMDPFDYDDCLFTAGRINNDYSIKLVCIEHEFGLFGGNLGEYLLGFLSLLDKPFIIRFHTVLPTPTEKMLKVVQSISMLAEKIIVMTKNSSRILVEDYRVIASKISIIPHGTHAHSTKDVTVLKQKYNLAGKQVLTTFGLLSPNKGIENGILAMKAISEKFPESIYVVLGQTHPNLLEQEGEKYRDFLEQLIVDNGLQENVRLINEYIPTSKLMEYLALTDIYLFTSKDANQAVSGTFLYAMSAGCPIISNAFVLATEMLDETTGVILKTGTANELADNAIRILHDPNLKHEMSVNAFLKTRNTTWKKVAEKHAELYYDVLGMQVMPVKLSSEYIF